MSGGDRQISTINSLFSRYISGFFGSANGCLVGLEPGGLESFGIPL